METKDIIADYNIRHKESLIALKELVLDKQKLSESKYHLAKQRKWVTIESMANDDIKSCQAMLDIINTEMYNSNNNTFTNKVCEEIYNATYEICNLINYKTEEPTVNPNDIFAILYNKFLK